MTYLAAIGMLGGLMFILAGLLVFARHRFRVDQDPRVDVVEQMLPNTNCGACGYPGCRAFAEALVGGVAAPAKCSVGNADDHARIASFLGVAVGVAEKRVARLACAGGANVAVVQANYHGEQTCRAAAQVAGGGRGCAWGCLGYADCAAACDFDAIHMSRFGLPVVDETRCTACGDCVTACPKDLFSIEPVSHTLWVACKSRDSGDEVLAVCEVGCTACGRCAMDAPPGLVSMQGNLPVVHYEAGIGQTVETIDRCPTGAIVWFDHDGRIRRGSHSKKVHRQTALEPVES